MSRIFLFIYTFFPCLKGFWDQKIVAQIGINFKNSLPTPCVKINKVGLNEREEIRRIGWLKLGKFWGYSIVSLSTFLLYTSHNKSLTASWTSSFTLRGLHENLLHCVVLILNGNIVNLLQNWGPYFQGSLNLVCLFIGSK